MIESALPLLRSFVPRVLSQVSRLRAERQAAVLPVIQSTDLVTQALDETLKRLRGGSIEDTWWHNILNRLGQKYISPDFLRTPALQTWLAGEQVAIDFKTLATTRLVSADEDDAETRTRLIASYSELTGEVNQSAAGPIDVVLAVLVASYIASIPSDQRASVGITQAGFKHVDARLDRLEELLPQATSDPLTQTVHTNEAQTELSRLLWLRVIDQGGSRRNIQTLLNRTRNGNLSATSTHTKATILYWAVRLCAAEPDTLGTAQQLREELTEIDSDNTLFILDALLAEANGRIDEALALVRDHDDPDSRSVVFGILARSRGEQAALDWSDQHDARDNPHFLTGVGWIQWAFAMTTVAKWEDACQHLATVDTLWSDIPVLAFVEGTINCAMLLPREHRGTALGQIPLYMGVGTSHGSQATHHHARATVCFDYFSSVLPDSVDQHLTKSIADWRLWLRLLDPNTTKAKAVRSEIQQRMDDGSTAVELMLFATLFDIQFDTQPVSGYLAHRRRFGGLSIEELLAEGLLFLRSMNHREYSAYLEQHRDRLCEVLQPGYLTTMQIDALVNDGQTKRARTLISTYASDLRDVDVRRLNLLIETREGADPRAPLESLYLGSDSLVDLRNLVSYVQSVNDRNALRPLVFELFNRERTIDNALHIVRCLVDPSNSDHEPLIEFLETNADLVTESSELKSAKAWALFRAGQLQDAKAINDDLLSCRTDQDDVHLDINIAVASGHWERVVAAIDREWPRRQSYDAAALMGWAYLSGQQERQPDRALQLASLAAGKAPDDPHILTAAYGLYFKLGRDSEANPKWLERAFELSSTEDGPLWRVRPKDAINEWFPKRRNVLQEVGRQWLRGELPVSIAAAISNISLSHIYLHSPDRNAVALDGRQRVILPTIAGGRAQVELQTGQTIGLDVTSVMILSHLDLLKQTIDSFHHVKLAPDILECLFQELYDTRFHQPSRIVWAKEVLRLTDAEQLTVVRHSTHLQHALIDEVGPELATLLSIATRDKGVVVCSQPIYRPDSLMERVANTSDYDRLILSTTDICTLLHAEGKLDTEEYRRAIVFLTKQGQTTRPNVTRESLDGPVYVESVALSYLHSAGVLHSVAATGLNLHVHPQVLSDTQALISAADTGHGLGTKLDDIRTLLRDAVDSGTATFLSRTADRDERIRNGGIRFQTTASLLAGSAACDAICIDDRAINRQPNIENVGRPPTSIVCVLDVLRHLVSCDGLKDRTDYWIARHKLRRGGFALIDVETDELVHWLRVTRVVDGQVMETAELRTLRQTITRIDSLNLLSHEETMAHSIHHSRACRTALECLWGDSSVAVERVAALSSWVWRNLMVGAVLGLEESAGENRRNRAGHLLSLRLGHLLLPTTVLTQERRSQFIDWLDQVALEPLRPANTELLESALESNWQAIVALEDHREVYGHWFLQQLPSSACEIVISKHPEFAERCGFKSSLVIEIGSAIKIESSELVHAVRDVLATNGHKTVHDVLGRTASVTIDPTTQHIVLTWSDSQGTSQQVPLQELAVLSPDRETKRKAFGSLVKRIGATGPDCLYSLRDRPSHDLNDREIAGLLTELTHGVATVHSRLYEKLSQGLSLTADDIVPKHVSYYESFGGPNPGLHDAEAYYREILIPYRQGILKNNVQAGLDICLLGALRDDLAPGQWLTEYHDDVVWDAMAACHARDNPFSLLGALDIALYRQTDARFAEFAAEAVRSLSSEQCGDRDDLDSCALFCVLVKFVANRINLLENGAKYPGHWKRM